MRHTELQITVTTRGIGIATRGLQLMEIQLCCDAAHLVESLHPTGVNGTATSNATFRSQFRYFLEQTAARHADLIQTANSLKPEIGFANQECTHNALGQRTSKGKLIVAVALIDRRR